PAHEPVGDRKRERHGGQANELAAAGFAEIHDDEFAGERKDGDHQHHPGLDDALVATGRVMQGVVEFQRDHDRQDFGKDGLKRLRLDRVEGAEDRPGDDYANEPEQRDHDHDVDDQVQRQGDDTFELLVEG